MSFRYIELDDLVEVSGFLVFERVGLNGLERKILNHLKSIKSNNLSKQIDKKMKLLLQKYEEKILECELTRKAFLDLGINNINLNTFLEVRDFMEKVKGFLFANGLLNQFRLQFEAKDFNNRFHLPLDLKVIVNYLDLVKSNKSKEEISRNIFKEIKNLKVEDKTDLIVEIVKNLTLINDYEEIKKLLINKRVKLLITSIKIDLFDEENDIEREVVNVIPKTISYDDIVGEINSKGVKDFFIKMVNQQVEKDKIAEILDIPIIKAKVKQKDLNKIVKLLK